MNLFVLTDLTKEYGEGDAKVTALNNVSLILPEGNFIVILGASGSGKSTLLNMLGCMDRPALSSRRLFFPKVMCCRPWLCFL